MKCASRFFAALLLTVAEVPPCAANQPSDYLPFAKGKQWILRSPSTQKPIVLEVLSVDGDIFVLRFDNPWIPSELAFTVHDGKYYVTSLTMNGKTARLPGGSLYWDFTANQGQTWSSGIGTEKIVSRSKTVHGMGTTYANCIQIEETNKQGNKNYWTFAPGVGFVQFGEGRDAFVIDRVSDHVPVSAVPSLPTSPTRGSKERSVSKSKTLIGLVANPFANEGMNARSIEARFSQARDAGVNFIYLSPKWNEIEPERGKYNFKDFDYQVGEAITSHFPAVLHLRVIDTNQRSTPGDLTKKKFTDREMIERLQRVLDLSIEHTQGSVRHFLIGNEIDSYFSSHRGEVDDFAALLLAVSRHIKSKVPGATVSVSTTFDGLQARSGLLRPIADRSDLLAVTYYPLTPDFYVRDPAGVAADFDRMLAEAKDRKVFLQEMGCPSSTTNRSSEQLQARMLEAVLDRISTNPDRFLAANFTFMSDFSDALVDQFSKYYRASGVDRFRSFLKTLGMFDDRGRPKLSWQVFQRKVRELTRG